jgi:hypothetical protein
MPSPTPIPERAARGIGNRWSSRRWSLISPRLGCSRSAGIRFGVQAWMRILGRLGRRFFSVLPGLAVLFFGGGVLAEAQEPNAPGARGEEAVHAEFGAAPHHYWTRPPKDAFTRSLGRLASLGAGGGGGGGVGELVELLGVLGVPVSSQLLVYSATSLQSGLITPANPRAIYFGEETYVGYVPGGRLEVASVDPELGPVFYLGQREAGGGWRVQRSERCMKCHAGRASEGVPGLVVESVLCTNTGASLDGFRREQTGHQVRLSERFGGWHVTGGGEARLGWENLLGVPSAGGYGRVENPPGRSFGWEAYPVRTSDVLAHLVLEHQLGFHNLVTLATYRSREVMAAGGGQVRACDEAALEALARRLVRYLLFADEAPLPSGGVTGDAAYRAAFMAAKREGKSGESLRDLDLKTRLLKYRCSYMVYTPSFRALPEVFLGRVRRILRGALQDGAGNREFSYLPEGERRVIREILEVTLPELLVERGKGG